ncbi:unnamed protein product [Echinostoma caproni]|uniref:sphinganine-1-phosphate aldolase n=1 Tax=Echinostoma caproni TaxID=27848 RepID=A0A183AHW4_9TREM|nr:unnamed protein product [Echinostoma caproni]
MGVGYWLIPESAHPAFDKAGHYFQILIHRIPVDPITYKVDVNAMRRAITQDTCMLVGSAPGFPHGVIDPIEEIAELGRKFGIPVHVDCCLGGFLLPFMDRADFPIEPFDFRLPGVTSISCDTHKYGFAAKGTSVIMYRNADYRAKQFFTQPDWSGGLYASPTFAVKKVNNNHYWAPELRLQKIPGIVVYGDPQVCVVAFGSDRFDIYRLSQGLSELPNGRGWVLNNLQFPAAVHLCVTDLHTAEGRAEAFIRDVASVAAELRDKPQLHSGGLAAIYGMSALIPDRSIVSRVARGFLDACYDTPDMSTTSTTESRGTNSPSNKKKS